jgi:ribonuclease HI
MNEFVDNPDADRRNWRRMRFKGNKVWQATDRSGRPLLKNGKALIKYRLEHDYEYWVYPVNLSSVDASGVQEPDRTRRRPEATGKPKESKPARDPSAIHIYTDGASSGNPGPSGIGIVMKYGNKTKEMSKFIGNTTNNVAELEAIRCALVALKRKNLPVRIYTDSSYAHGVLALGWKARKNRSCVEAIRTRLATLDDVSIIKVRGHAGHPDNERADQLARAACASGSAP